MNKQELIKHFEEMDYVSIHLMGKQSFIDLIEQLDEPQPLRLKDVIARMEGLSEHTRSEWLDDILYKFGSNYGASKYKAGYKQGKLEGEWVGQQLKDADKIRQELNKPVVPQFVAGWINYCKNTNVSLVRALLVEEVVFYNYANQKDSKKLKEFLKVKENQEIFARAWIDGYEVEKEKRYTVKIKAVDQYLVSAKDENFLGFLTSKLRTYFTRKELEDVGFGWVFDCEGIEIEEVGDDSKI